MIIDSKFGVENIPSELQTFGANSGMSSSPESETQGINAYRIELSMHKAPEIKFPMNT